MIEGIAGRILAGLGETIGNQSSVIGRQGEPLPAPRSTILIVPSASTTSTPSTHLRTLPYLTVRGPAAFVATMPPLVAKAPEEGSGGRRSPYGWAASFTSAHVTDAPARALRLCGSTTRSVKPMLRSTMVPDPTLPPGMPLPAPRGINAVREPAA